MKFPHESLVAWQRADDLFISVHLLSKKKFPADERFALTSQTRRAAFSVAANIVEGRARKHDRERAQFLRTAWGSLAEVSYCLHAAKRLGYLTASDHDAIEREVKAAAAPLFGLLKQAEGNLEPKPTGT
ncbi:MAG: four helix bundle protein [Acidobacteria bacterium]|nr:MAG: four helix bundle protein [Acidobacteriota bacterium]